MQWMSTQNELVEMKLDGIQLKNDKYHQIGATSGILL